MGAKTKSFGLTCFRQGDNGIEVCLVRSDYTYAFQKFVQRFDFTSMTEAAELIGKMTFHEKKILLLKDFDLMWKICWNLDAARYFPIFIANSVKQRKENFNRFSNSKEYSNIIRSAPDAPDDHFRWSIPKGRRNFREKFETDSDIAVREFCEETSYNKSRFVVDPKFKREFSQDVKYSIVFFLALWRGEHNVKNNNFTKDQVVEVSEVRWLTLSDVIYHCPHLYPHLKPAFRYVKNITKVNKKNETHIDEIVQYGKRYYRSDPTADRKRADRPVRERRDPSEVSQYDSDDSFRSDYER